MRKGTAELLVIPLNSSVLEQHIVSTMEVPQQSISVY